MTIKTKTKNAMDEWAQVKIDGELTNYLISKTGILFDLEKGKICKLSKKWTNNKDQEKKYYVYDLKLKDKYKQVMIHRLVAEAFIYKKQSNLVVDHIDENTLNNNIENLQWLSIGENVAKSLSQEVIAYYFNFENDKKGEYVGTFSSLSKCCKILDLSNGTASKVLNKKQKQTKGYYIERSKSDFSKK